MVEVYNEAIYDLLAAPEDFHEKLTIQKKGKDIIVPVSTIACCRVCLDSVGPMFEAIITRCDITLCLLVI